MDDRVGEILAQRAKLENGAGAGIFFSILLHTTLTALTGWSAWHHSSTESTSTMTIRFAQTAPEITPAVQPAPVTEPVVQPQPKPIEKPKPSKKTAPPSPFGKSPKKAAEPIPQQPSNPVTQQPPVEVPVGGSGVTQLEGGDFPYSIYIERMKTLI